MSESVFNGLRLVSTPLRYGGLDATLRLDGPVAAHLRAIIDGWVAGDSKAARSKIRTDLLSRHNSLGTFTELLLRQILRRKFGEVEREPKGLPVGRGNPDYGVRVGRTGRLVVFESAAIKEKISDQLRKRREIMERLARIVAPGTSCWTGIPPRD